MTFKKPPAKSSNVACYSITLLGHMFTSFSEMWFGNVLQTLCFITRDSRMLRAS